MELTHVTLLHFTCGPFVLIQKIYTKPKQKCMPNSNDILYTFILPPQTAAQWQLTTGNCQISGLKNHEVTFW
jgi:hypothetical protein